MANARPIRLGVAVIAFSAFVAGACDGGGSKTATPTLSADEASTATVVAGATATAEDAAVARSTAAAAFAGISIKQGGIVTGATHDPASSMPTFIIRLDLDNQTGKSVQFVGDFVVRLADGSEVAYGSYRCSKVAVVEAPEGTAATTMQACADERATPLTPAEALTLAQGATLVRARLIFEGDVTSPWYTPDGSLAPT